MKRSISCLRRGLARSPLTGMIPTLILAVAAAGTATTAGASPFFTMTGGTTYVTALESFDWVTPRSGPNNDLVTLWEGGTLGLSEQGYVTLEYIGKEALFDDNIFRWNNVDIFTTGSGTPLIQGQTAATPFPPAAISTYAVPGVVSAGALPFSFFITNFGINVPNDGNLDIAFWPIPGDTSGSPIDFGTTVYVMLDDENTVDTDHDDMIVRMTVSPVPEPGTLALAAVAALPLAGWLNARRLRRRREDSGASGVAEPADVVPRRELEPVGEADGLEPCGFSG